MIYTKTSSVCRAEELILSHLEVMDGHIKRIEDLRMDISKIEPNFSSSNIDISFTFEGRACSKTINICEVLKKIKYECSKLNKSITKKEKEAEITRPEVSEVDPQRNKSNQKVIENYSDERVLCSAPQTSSEKRT